ncbi:endospore germination permease [Paenibacillus tarimensis]
MLENAKIAARQFAILVFMFTAGSSLLLAPGMLAAPAKQDAWLSGILGVGAGLLFGLIYTKLGTLYPDKNLAQYSEQILGKWVGKAVSILFLPFPFLLASLVLRNIGDFLTTYIMPETPIQFIHILMLIVVMMGIRLGIETIARAAEIIFPWFIILFLLLVIFVSPQIDAQKIQPVLEEGIKPVLHGALLLAAYPFMEYATFLFIIPYVNRPGKVGKAFFAGTIMGGAVIVLLTALSILVLGADHTARDIYPSYVLAQKINIGDFLQRIEAIIAGLWFISIFFKLSISFYAATFTLAQILNLKEYRMLVFPLGMMVVVFSLASSPNIIYNIAVILEVWVFFAGTFGLLLPLVLLGVAAFRKRHS